MYLNIWQLFHSQANFSSQQKTSLQCFLFHPFQILSPNSLLRTGLYLTCNESSVYTCVNMFKIDSYCLSIGKLVGLMFVNVLIEISLESERAKPGLSTFDIKAKSWKIIKARVQGCQSSVESHWREKSCIYTLEWRNTMGSEVFSTAASSINDRI